MRPLTEDQLSMLLSNPGITNGDLGLDEDQIEAMATWRPLPLVATRTEYIMHSLDAAGLIPCGFCFGTGETRGMSWSNDVSRVFRRRFICNYCEGTGVAR